MSPSDFLTEAANSLFLLVVAVAIYYSMKWRGTQSLSKENKGVIYAWEMIYLSVGVRVGYWALALHFAPLGKTYHPDFVANKHWIAMPTALLFAFGVLKFIRIVERFSLRRKFVYFVLLTVLAGIVAYI